MKSKNCQTKLFAFGYNQNKMNKKYQFLFFEKLKFKICKKKLSVTSKILNLKKW